MINEILAVLPLLAFCIYVYINRHPRCETCSTKKTILKWCSSCEPEFSEAVDDALAEFIMDRTDAEVRRQDV